MADERIGKHEGDVYHNNIEACSFPVTNVNLNKNNNAK